MARARAIKGVAHRCLQDIFVSSAPVTQDPAIKPGLPRAWELLCAGALLGLGLPALAAGICALRLAQEKSLGGVFFLQRRVGKGGVAFNLIKLRTMRAAAHAQGDEVTAANDDRITPLGRWLRRLKFDELPQLWNVLKGDMALVGPRPEVEVWVDSTDPLWQIVLQARPGITSPMAIFLRHEEALVALVPAADRPEALAMLLRYKLIGHAGYLRRRTWALDGAILLETLLASLFPRLYAAPTWNDIQALVAAYERDGAGGKQRASSHSRRPRG